MKEYYNCNQIISCIYRELFQNDLTVLQKQRPFLQCTNLMTVEQAAVFLLRLKQHFRLPEEIVLKMIESEKFTYNTICETVLSYCANE